MFAWILSLSAAFAVALNGTMVTPIIVLAISRLPGWDEGSATLVAACEIAGLALYGILFPHMAKRHGKIVAVVGFLAVILGEAATSLFIGAWSLAASRLTTGLGEGAIFGLVASHVASRSNAERLWGQINLIGGATMGLLMLSLSLLPSDLTGAPVFLYLAGFAALVAPLALYAERRTSDSLTVIVPVTLSRGAMILTLSVVFLIYAVQAGQWAVAAFIGEIGNIDPARVVTYLAIASLLGFVGALVPTLSKGEKHRVVSIVAGFSTMAISLWCFFNLVNETSFVASQITLNTGFYMVTPYVTGLLTEGDPDGSLLSRVLIVALIGASVGTAVAGPILQTWGSVAFGWAYITPLGLAMIAAVVVFGKSHLNCADARIEPAK
ncbi:MFS transporter [Bradyrhizobium sp. SZCCHNS1054]|uniref:MFS transporter n=1 Tax=Bradyrhizobium sp. SZCCHNS1054 TaxID=3057301 RepID=UPI0029169A8A|nr:MFS transporter [Bradyrhizobium sp. SZCCHNS1054]